MRCVCPMGGDRTCPNDCPLAKYEALSEADRSAQRKFIAKELEAKGLTQSQIATQLGVSQKTISKDLIYTKGINQKPAKTKSNPKGAGRPKGKSKPPPGPKVTAVGEAIRSLVEAGEPVSQKRWARRLGVGTNTVQRAVLMERARIEAEPNITPEMLSMSAKQKLDIAIRQYQRKLDAAFENRVLEEINQRLDHIILPVWRKKIADAKKIYDVRRAITDEHTFKLIVKCLHTDTRRHVSDDVANEAFVRFMALEKYLLNEKASPTKFNGLPTTPAEWEQRKQQAAEIRRVKRGHSNVGRTIVS